MISQSSFILWKEQAFIGACYFTMTCQTFSENIWESWWFCKPKLAVGKVKFANFDKLKKTSSLFPQSLYQLFLIKSGPAKRLRGK